MSADLEIRLLGGFTVGAGGRAVPDDGWRLRKAKTIVKLLALAPDHRLHREAVAELLWPDRDRDAALNNLHQALHAARRALGAAGMDGAACLALRDDALSLCPGGTVAVDVESFEAAVRHARASRAPQAYRDALDAGGGELLPEDAYEPWVTPRSAALRELRLALHLELAELLEAAGDRAGAVDALQRAVADSPVHEGAHRRLIELFAADGRRQDALAQYQTLRDELDRRLAAEPDPETSRLYRQLLSEPHDGPAPPGAATVAAPRRTNLPGPLTSFIGRVRERGAVERDLGRARLVTLTGPGGCGKTRLALEAAGALEPPEGGTWLVELAALSEPAAVAEAVAAALGLQTHAGRGPLATLAEHLAYRTTLLVVDNCEHLVGACADLAAALLAAAPGLRILATSREPLRVAGEVVHRVPSLTLPDAGADPADLDRSEAVRLFSDRARAAAPGFVVDAGNGAAVIELCRRLDGMPLALELAAARVGLISPDQITARLGAGLDVLGGGPRRATRQQTLRATLEWSHDLLDVEERVLLRRLAGFAGSFDLDAVEAVCGGEGLSAPVVVDVLGRLAAKSLLLVEPVAVTYRYRLLEVVRQFAGGLLAAAGEAPAVAARHRAHYLAVAERGVARPDALEADHANLSAAMASALDADAVTAHRLAAVLCRYWMARGHFAEGGRWLDAVLARPGGPPELRARLLLDAAALDLRRGKPERLLSRAEEALALRERLPGRAEAVQAGVELALLYWVLAEPDAAEHRVAEALAAAGPSPADAPAVATAVHLRAALALSRGSFAEARDGFADAVRRLDAVAPATGAFFPAFTYGFCPARDSPRRRARLRFEETLVLFRRVGAASAAAYALVNASFAARTAEDHDAAAAALGEALDRFDAAEDRPGRSVALNLSGHAARQRGELDVARDMLERSLALRRELGEVRGVAMGISGLGLLALVAGDAEEARIRLEEAHRIFERTEDVPGLGNGAAHLGHLELDLGDPARAVEPLRRSLAITRRQRILRPLGWQALALAEAEAAVGDEAAARAALDEAAATFTALGDNHGLSVLRAQMAPSAP